MAQKLKHINVKRDTTWSMAQYVKEEYLNHHPEMREIKISENKIIYEAFRYYLLSTKYEKFIPDMVENKNGNRTDNK